MSRLIYYGNGITVLITHRAIDLDWLTEHSELLGHLKRGLERESLRVNPQGYLAQTPHSNALGAALTHRWITTDFAEAMVEFTTPVKNEISTLLQFLQDLHRHTLHHLDGESLWPLSMPDLLLKETPIALANYGSSLLGRFKTLYRQGLQQRYGATMQCIAGVHYNLSFPPSFWLDDRTESPNHCCSAGYFRLIRNYYRFGWIIPYLFGASPAITTHFLRNCKTTLPFEPLTDEIWSLPYATSLRLSEIGYNNRALPYQPPFNQLKDYIEGLQQLLQAPSPEFEQLGVAVRGSYQQLNSCVLQLENEFYFPIRPKANQHPGERQLQALRQRGVDYIEVRALDLNPFSPIGVDASQLRFIDLFLVWCALTDPTLMTPQEFAQCQNNWQRICIAGRQPGQVITLNGRQQKPLAEVGEALFAELQAIAILFDQNNPDNPYQRVCQQLAPAMADPSLTLSAQLIALIKQGSKNLHDLGLSLAQGYRETLMNQPLQIITEHELVREQQRSLAEQQKLEQCNRLNFDQYLAQQLTL
jgi:glutamate--cysteine ligase